MLHFLSRCGPGLALLLLSACQGYDVTLNERVVYSPPPLFRAFDITDDALRACVQQVIEDESITRAGQLESLNCSNAGIESIEGLQVFSGLTRVRLSDNRIRNLLALGELQQLQQLYLSNNRVVDPVPLYALEKLTTLDLDTNPALQCPAPGALSQVEQLSLPAHCPGDN